MDFTPIAPTDLRDVLDQELVRRAEYLINSSSALSGGHTKYTLDAVREHLRTINSYYSNKIESEGTRPIDIERAMKNEYSDDSKKRSLQTLSLAHIDTQKMIEHYHEEGQLHPYSIDFINSIHATLYSKAGMDEFLIVKGSEKEMRMIPGQLREENVAISGHVAPSPSELPSLMGKFETLYGQSLYKAPAHKLLYALSSHHRLTYLHPYLDGNGRTSRLALDAALMGIGLTGYGLWNISRGLARNESEYRKMLSLADTVRQGDYDGKGALSSKALGEFVSFMLVCAQDQVDYMNRYLKMDSLASRFEKYVMRSQDGFFDIDPLPKNSERLFKELLLKGEFKERTEVDEILGVSRRKGSEVTKELLARGYFTSDGPKKSLRLKIESHLANYLFPELSE